MANFLAPIINGQQFDANGDPLSSGTIEVYLAGTSTPATTYTTQAGGTPNTFPIDLNTLGVNEDGEIWLIGGASYKFIIKDSAGVTLRTLDNISGINDSAVSTDQWLVYQATPTYVSATSFTVAGDQTQTFQIRRRLKTQNTGGLIYSTITNSVYANPNTTVTVQNDSGVLDSGLSQVSYGIISALDSSLPSGLLIGLRTFTASTTYTPTAGTKSIVVTVVGGGGGGGGAAGTAAGQCASGAGGGGGGWATKRVTSAFSGVAITIGAAGSAVGPGNNGGNGGTTSFGAIVTASGGGGGTNGTAQPNTTVQPSGSGVGGIGSGGDLNFQGGAGKYALYGINSVSGEGGSSFFGAGASGVTTYATGLTSTVLGGGGSGGNTPASNGSGASSGAGLGGACIIWEYA